MSYKASEYDIDQQIADGGGGGGVTKTMLIVPLVAEPIPNPTASLLSEVDFQPFRAPSSGVARFTIIGTQANAPSQDGLGAATSNAALMLDDTNGVATEIDVTENNPLGVPGSPKINMKWTYPVVAGTQYMIRFKPSFNNATTFTGTLLFEMI
jgi:hypothetical protein